MDDAQDLNTVAAELGFTFESAKKALELAAAEAARENTARANGKSCVVPDLKTTRLLAAYEALQKIHLSEPAFTERERARLAAKIVDTRRALRKRGVEPGTSDTLRAAMRILQAQYRQRQKKRVHATHQDIVSGELEVIRSPRSIRARRAPPQNKV